MRWLASAPACSASAKSANVSRLNLPQKVAGQGVQCVPVLSDALLLAIDARRDPGNALDRDGSWKGRVHGVYIQETARILNDNRVY